MRDCINIDYNGLSIPSGCTDMEAAAELLLDQIIQKSEIPYSEEEVEQELNLELAGFMQTMRYRAMGGDYQLEEVDLDEWRVQARREISREHQVDVILSTIIEQEKITVSEKELEAAALELAGKEQTTLEMVQRFMGEDYALLKKDVLYKKAKEYIVYKLFDRCGDKEKWHR